MQCLTLRVARRFCTPYTEPIKSVFITNEFICCVTALTEVFANESEAAAFPLGNFVFFSITDLCCCLCLLVIDTLLYEQHYATNYTATTVAQRR